MKKTRKHWLTRSVAGMLALGAAVLSCAAFSGCQVSVGGQTLPSAYYLKDDLQYFPKGPEFKLTNEANALKAARANAELNR
ncbi:MAG TPA: hypothetical protein PKD64_14850 [Pirellulaceae bacterium]|nr:hypothetical protein [Pirellulaceae bacterium]HMO93461.1 hypothetical protein [Pirellulaceae bacterium]HMP68431.1 hypothetical protein [Pirellulaceae bacterium]